MICCGLSTSASPGLVFTTGDPLSQPHAICSKPVLASPKQRISAADMHATLLPHALA